MPSLEILGIFDNLAKLVINPTIGGILFGKMLKIASKKGAFLRPHVAYTGSRRGVHLLLMCAVRKHQ